MSTIIANKIRQEGLSLVFRTNPTVGLLALTAFVDNAIGSYTKIFRYSKNGIIFSDWAPLTAPNIVAITIAVDDVFIVEITYYTTDLAATNTTLSFTATTGSVDNSGKVYFENSLFKKYFESDDVDVLNWYINVLEKLYEKGLIPSYISRLDEFKSPDDFLALWASVSRFFAFYVELARTFSQFYNNENLIKDFLKQRGLNTSPEDTLEQLQNMLETYYFQMGQRGTERMLTEGDEENQDGELKRLIHYKRDVDEFLFCLHRKHHFGWNVSNCSPLYKGLRINDGLNKIPWSKGYVSVEEAVPFTTGATLVTDGDNDVLDFASGGNIHFALVDKVKIDPRLDYQISFQIKMTSGTVSLGLIGYDVDGNVVQLKSRVNNSTENSFFEDIHLSRDDKYLTVKCYLYNKDRGIFAQDTPNVKQGQNLLAVSLLNKIGFMLSVSDEAKIFDIRIMPMQTSYSRGFVQVNNFISMWLINRTGQFNIPQLEDYIRQYMIPYDCHLKITDIADYLYSATQEPNDSLYWVGAGQYCRKIVWVGIDPSCDTQNLIWVPEEDTAYCEQE